MFSVKYVFGHHGLFKTFIAKIWIISLFGGKSALIDKVVVEKYCKHVPSLLCHITAQLKILP